MYFLNLGVKGLNRGATASSSSNLVRLFIPQVEVCRIQSESEARKKRKRKPRRGDDDEDSEQDDGKYIFLCNRWLARNEDDGQIVRELVPTDSSGGRRGKGSLPGV